MRKKKAEEQEPQLEETEISLAAQPLDAAVAETVAASTEPAVDTEVSDLEAKLAEAEQKAAEYMDGWQRSQAAFANFRKRTEAENINLRKAANAGLLARLVPVVDDFQRAFQSVPDELKGLETPRLKAWLDGFTMIQRKVVSILKSEAVHAIALEPGDAFDPMFHQAVLYQEVKGFEEGQVVAIVEQGYVLGERVLRPAMVVVAKSPEVVAPVETSTELAGDAIVIDAEVAVESETDVVVDADSKSTA